MTNITTKKFCNEHGIRVIDSSKRAHKHTKANVFLFRYADDYNKFLDTLGTPKVIVIDGNKCGPNVVGGVRINYVPPDWILDYYEVLE